jgi:hypothetical protein
MNSSRCLLSGGIISILLPGSANPIASGQCLLDPGLLRNDSCTSTFDRAGQRMRRVAIHEILLPVECGDFVALDKWGRGIQSVVIQPDDIVSFGPVCRDDYTGTAA